MSDNSTAQMPGELGIPTLAPLFADGMPVAALGTALGSASAATGATRFWSTPPRATTDETRDVLEVAMGAARTVNTISVQLPHFPHTSWLQAYDQDAGVWNTLVDTGGNEVSATVTDSLPPKVAAGVNAEGRRHPQHFGAGHWVRHAFTFTPTTCTRIRLVQVRIPSGSAPVGPTGAPVAYSLGAKDLIIGYSTGAPGGAPLRPGVIAQATDILGSAVEHTVRRQDAWGLPLGRPWRSAAQPVANAVVALYADVRDALGQPQVLDRLTVDPITSGVSMCVYYATSAVRAPTFPAADAPLGTQTVPAPINPALTGAALVFTGASCYLDVAANAVGYDPGAPFGLGLTFAPGYSSADPGPYTLLDTGALTLTLASGQLTAAFGSLRAAVSAPFTAGQSMIAAVVFNGVSLSLTWDGYTSSATSGSLPAVSPTASIRIGGALGSTPYSGSMTLASLLLWQCDPQVIASGMAAYLDTGSVALPSFEAGPSPTDGTTLRIDPSLAGPDSPYGIFGGPGIDTAATVWTPIARDAVARSGALPLPPVSAALIKIEFTNLAAAAFDVAAPLAVTTTLADPARQQSAATASPGAPDTGTAVTAATGSAFFSDMQRLPSANPQPVSPTEALYAPDPRVANQVDTLPGFGFTPWQQQGQAVAPRLSGTHADASIGTVLNRRAAFYVALRTLALGRDAAGSAPRDYARVVESMDDGMLLGPTNTSSSWELHSGMIVTPAATAHRRIAISASFLTHNPVVAAQFAAQASEARQVITDADFTAPTLVAWTPVGDATLAVGTGYASAVGHAVSVTRSAGGVGGISSVQTFTPGRTGRLHAAARFYAPQSLTSPLVLQLVNGDGTVLSSSTATATAGQVVELSCSLLLDTPLASGTNAWSVYDTHFTYATMAAHGTYALLSGSGTWVHDVTVRLVQNNVDSDVFYVDSLAMFHDPITWELSRDGGTTWFNVNDIRNNPAAVLVFPPLGSGTGTQLAWRASCDAPGVSVTSVALRPWYELRAGGVRPQPPGIPAGPHLSPADHYGPIEDDPYWQAWDSPIPKGWWAASHASR